MVLTIVKWVAIAMILSLIALWLWEGGYWKIANLANVIPNPLTASTTDNLYQLPGQPTFFEVPDTTSAASDMEYGAYDAANPSDALYAEEAKSTAGRSPYAQYIDLQIGGADSSDVSREYILIRASTFAAVPIPVSGWTLKSLYTGRRAVIPLAASPFVQGVVNTVRPITLGSGESVIVSSGVSPVGVSFRESTCTGYLAELQQFSPSLSNACPRPTDLLPRSGENAERYGYTCLDFVERLPQCSYPSLVPSDLSPSCRAYLANTFTYSGCMNAYGTNATNMLSTWRAYESSTEELWLNAHDTIVVQDTKGRTVGTINY